MHIFVFTESSQSSSFISLAVKTLIFFTELTLNWREQMIPDAVYRLLSRIALRCMFVQFFSVVENIYLTGTDDSLIH